MHELALMESLVDAVSEKLGQTRVASVRLEIGQLVAAVPETLRFCFELCSRGTGLEGAELDIVEIPGRARCRECSAEVALGSGLVPCRCGSFDLEVTAGEELRVRDVEVVT